MQIGTHLPFDAAYADVQQLYSSQDWEIRTEPVPVSVGRSSLIIQLIMFVVPTSVVTAWRIARFFDFIIILYPRFGVCYLIHLNSALIPSHP
jgi:hypothetical protein